MKFTKTTVDAVTVVTLDLEALDLPGCKLDSEDTACVFEGTRDFDFTIVNKFLGSLNEPMLRRMAMILTSMRRCIANCGHDDPAADECVGKLQPLMQGLFDSTSSNLTENLFGELYNFSAKYTTSDKVYNHADTRQMLLATSLLSALCIMVIHDFEAHFTDVSEPFRVLYPVFEEAIKNCGIEGAKEFVEEKWISVWKLDEDTASWVIEGIYINDWMLRKYEQITPIDICVLENYAQRILSSKTYVSSKRIREMKEINEAEEQQRNDKAKVENNEAKDATSSVTPLTDDEVKKFNKEIDCILCSPVRNSIKDALDAILFTVKVFYRNFPSTVGHTDLSTDGLINATTKVVSAAMRSVDEMDVAELRRIAERADYVHAAFKLVESCLPDGMLSCKDQLSCVKDYVSLRARYLRKVSDIGAIADTQTNWYDGADINYVSTKYLKSKLAECPGGATLASAINVPGDPGYMIYGNILPTRNTEQPSVISTLKHWADENVDDSCRDKFFAFVMRHEADVFNYAKIHRNDLVKSDEIYVFFYRWFLKEQEQAS